MFQVIIRIFNPFAFGCVLEDPGNDGASPVSVLTNALLSLVARRLSGDLSHRIEGNEALRGDRNFRSGAPDFGSGVGRCGVSLDAVK